MDPLIPEVLDTADSVGGALASREAIQADAARLFADLARSGTAANTARAYAADYRYFSAWHRAYTGDEPHIPLAAATVQVFIGHHAQGLPEAVAAALLEEGFLKVDENGEIRRGKLSSLRRRVSSLAKLHTLAGVEEANNPARGAQVKVMLKNAAKTASKAGERRRKARPIVKGILDRMLATCDDSLRGKRDRALLLFAFSTGGRRRSEVSEARLEDLHEAVDPLDVSADAYDYVMPRSKTDQEGEAVELPLLGQAAVAMRGWLEGAGIREGRIFRAVNRWESLGEGLTPKTVNRIVKARALGAGLDASKYSAHSLRSGFCTQSGTDGVLEVEARAMSGHKSLEVFSGYQRVGNLKVSRAARLAG